MDNYVLCLNCQNIDDDIKYRKLRSQGVVFMDLTNYDAAVAAGYALFYIYELRQKYFLTKDDLVSSVYRAYALINDTEFSDKLRDVFIEYDQIGVEFRQAFLYLIKGNYVKYIHINHIIVINLKE